MENWKLCARATMCRVYVVAAHAVILVAHSALSLIVRTTVQELAKVAFRYGWMHDAV
jgi:hypothetical protein